MAHVLRNWKFVVGGATVYAGATGAGYLYMLSLKEPEAISTSYSEREKVYDSIASDYDKGLSWGTVLVLLVRPVDVTIFWCV